MVSFDGGVDDRVQKVNEGGDVATERQVGGVTAQISPKDVSCKRRKKKMLIKKLGLKSNLFLLKCKTFTEELYLNKENRKAKHFLPK